MKRTYLLLAAMVASSSAIADTDEGRFDQQGFGGEISLLTGYGSSKDNLSTETSIKTGTLNSEAKSDSTFMVAPFGQLRYTFDDQQVFVGMSRDDIVEGVFALELGYAFAIGTESSLSFSYLPTIMKGEVWEDPYLVNTERKTTDVSGNAYRIQFENIGGIGIDGDLAYYDREIDNEKSGSALTANSHVLKRDGNGYMFSLAGGLPISENIFVMPSISYHKFSADGKAMAYDEYSLGLTGMYQYGQHRMALNGEYSKADYDAENPLFGKTREDSGYGVNLTYEYSDFLGWQDVGFNVLAGYDVKDSNITFYDKSDYMIGMGVSYLF